MNTDIFAISKRWLRVLAKQLLALYNVMVAMSAPQEVRRETLGLSRRHQRQLAPTGMVRVDRETLRKKAEEAIEWLFNSILSAPLLIGGYTNSRDTQNLPSHLTETVTDHYDINAFVRHPS